MALFGKMVKQVVYEYSPVMRPSLTGQQVNFMQTLRILCNNDSIHVLPISMKCISTVPHEKYGFMFIYACPYGRTNGNPCNMREGWVLKKGKPFKLWRAVHDGR